MECTIENTGNILLAKLSGQFIFSDHPAFKSVLNAASEKDIHHIRIDFARVDFIDSAGLGMLLLLRDTCEKNKKTLVLAHPAGQVKKVFDISKFEHLFTLEA